MKLYKVTLNGMRYAVNGDTAYGKSYVVANDPTEAYLKVRNWLDKEDLGFKYERRLSSIVLLADDRRYGNSSKMLFL